MRSTEFKDDPRFSEILENAVKAAKKKRDEEDRIFGKAVQEAGQPMCFNLEAARWCGSCGKDEALHMCSACSVACYCSQECQKRHWKIHKEICSKLQNAETELYALRDMGAIFRSPIVSLNDERRAFVCWKQVRTSIEFKGQKLKSHNSTITIGRFSYIFTMTYIGDVKWIKGFKTKGISTVRLQVPYQEFKEAGFNTDAPWLSDVDACRC